MGQIALKLAASVMLLLIGGMCLRGVWVIWFSKRFVYQPFAYTKDGAQDSPAGAHFTDLVDQELRSVDRLLSPPEDGQDPLVVIPTVNQQGGQIARFELPTKKETLIPELDIKAYGIQVSALANKFYEQVVPPDAVTGSVSETQGAFEVYADLRMRNSAPSSTLVSQLPTKNDAAFAIACHLFLRLPPKNQVLATATDAEFEVWMRALRQYQLYKESIKAVRDPKTAQQSLEKTEELLLALRTQKSTFPLVYKLSALVAASKGQFADALGYLAKYFELLKVTDPNASALLASYQSSAEKGKATAQLKIPDRARPVRPGMSVGFPGRPTSSRICCIVQQGGTLCALIAPFGASPGSNVLQPPGGKVPDDVIGTVLQVEQSSNAVGALVQLSAEAAPAQDDKVWTTNILTSADQGVTVVQKLGEKITSGKVESVNATVSIQSDIGLLVLTNAIVVKGAGGPFSGPGDAGAPVVVDIQNSGAEFRTLVGMVIAANSDNSTTIVIPITSLFSRFNVSLGP
ncbi:MAG TPA: hypothetical protein VFG04_13950 [Planctomycetaceae bacterium]|jgi:hypothetical protein|nr:hypothetical protein [Planctomycetaceae bacterium]